MKYTYHYMAEPFDVLFFRNNKAFDFGEWYSEGFFPPLPSTFQGFVRTSILLRHNLLTKGQVKWSEAKPLIGDHENFPLDLRGPFLSSTAAVGGFYFPTPRDIIKEKDNNGSHRARQIQLSQSSIETDLGPLYFAAESGKLKLLNFEQDFIRDQDLLTYRMTGKFCLTEEAVVFTEARFGIALQANKQVEEHRFYLTPYQRLNQHIALYFQLKSNKQIHDLTNQHSRLGSEGRGAVIRATKRQLSLKMPDDFYRELAKARRFKMIFLQPAILPEDFNLFNNLNGIAIGNVNVRLLYAATDQRLKISGVDFKNTSSNPAGHKSRNSKNYKLKTMDNAIPEGSVFYFEILNDQDDATIAASLKDLDDSKIAHGNYSAMGYNHIVLGKII
ncbi:type III-B CRISPR module-associated Cmr3 family protein [Calditrichota bacterium LG25]